MNGRLRAALALGLMCALLAQAAPTLAAEAPEVGSAEAVAAARAHFTKGRALYQAGAYREAIVELDAAHALDPKAKDLVFNLAVVHEKLADIDEALRYARLYAEMDLEPAERTRAESYIKRLEGAKSEIAAKEAATVTRAATPVASAPVRGRIDVLTITAAGVAIVAAGVGVGVGVKALADQPANSTSATMPYTSLASDQSSAHTEAIVADVCFGTAIVAAGVAAGLYFGRYRDAAPGTAQKHARSLDVTPVVGPTVRGLALGGTF